MNEDQLTQPAGPSKTSHNYLPLIICTLITAIIVGGGTYLFGSRKSAASEVSLQQEITALNKKLTEIKEKSSASTVKAETEKKTTEETETTANSLPTWPQITLSKEFQEKDGKKFINTQVQYIKNEGAEAELIHEMSDELIRYDENSNNYWLADWKISHQGKRYLTISTTGHLNPGSSLTFDITTKKPVDVSFPGFGSIYFSDDEKYLAYEGIGGIDTPGLSIEVVNGKKVECLITKDDIIDFQISDGVLTYEAEKIDNLTGEKYTKTLNIDEHCASPASAWPTEWKK